MALVALPFLEHMQNKRGSIRRRNREKILHFSVLSSKTHLKSDFPLPSTHQRDRQPLLQMVRKSLKQVECLRRVRRDLFRNAAHAKARIRGSDSMYTRLGHLPVLLPLTALLIATDLLDPLGDHYRVLKRRTGTADKHRD